MRGNKNRSSRRGEARRGERRANIGDFLREERVLLGDGEAASLLVALAGLERGEPAVVGDGARDAAVLDDEVELGPEEQHEREQRAHDDHRGHEHERGGRLRRDDARHARRYEAQHLQCTHTNTRAAPLRQVKPITHC